MNDVKTFVGKSNDEHERGDKFIKLAKPRAGCKESRIDLNMVTLSSKGKVRNS